MWFIGVRKTSVMKAPHYRKRTNLFVIFAALFSKDTTCYLNYNNLIINDLLI